MDKKYFTVDSAQKSLEKNKEKFMKLYNLKKLIDALLSVRIDNNEIEIMEFVETIIKLNKEYHKMCFEFYKLLEKFQKTGIIIKDIDKGILDFTAKFEGRDIFFCWKIGEEKIAFWHEIDSGFEERNRIIDLEEEHLA